MITKKDVRDLDGKATFSINTIIDLNEFLDIYQNDSEWKNIDDLKDTIKEYLFDNIEQTIKNSLKNGFIDSNVEYDIRIKLD